MAKSLTFIDLSTPSNLTGTAIAGGTLATNTTYFYRVVAIFNVTGAAGGYGGKSLASNECSVTTTTINKSVTLTFNYPKGTCGSYLVYRGTSSGYYVSGLTGVYSDATVNVGGTCTITDTGFGFAGNNNFQNTSHGKIVLASTQPTTDIWSIKDVYDLCVAGGFSSGVISSLDASTYRVEANLVCYNAIQWVDEEKTIIIADHWENSGASNYRFGRLTGSITNRPCHIIFKSFAMETFSPLTLNAYKTTFDCVYDYNLYFGTYQGLTFNSFSWSVGELRDCQFNKIRLISSNSRVNCYLTNSTITEPDVAFGQGAAVINNCTFYAGSRVFQTGGNTIIYAKDVTSIGNNRLVLVIGLNNQITTVNTNVPTSAFSVAYNCAGTWVDEKFNYNLTVYQSESATPINGASVKIYDAQNNLICDTTTNATGVIAEQELIFRRIDYAAGTPSPQIVTLKAPHKMIITATGYETYTQYTNYTGANRTQHVIGLKPVKSIRGDVDGNVYKALSPELGSSANIVQL